MITVIKQVDYVFECFTELQVQNKLDSHHRRSSHVGTSSLDSSSIYALLSFDSSPENGNSNHISCKADSCSVQMDCLQSTYCTDSILVRENAKCHCKKETASDVDRTSVVSAVPNFYVDSISAAAMKKQVVASLPGAETSNRVQSQTSKDNSPDLSAKDNVSATNGLISVGGDIAELPSVGDKASLHGISARVQQHCPEVNRRRYSCGDQLAATWWRLLDNAASFSDLRGLPRSLSRFCCTTWRTFTGVKSPCVDVSKVGRVDHLQPCSRRNTDTADASAEDERVKQTVKPWWHKPVSPDRRRLIEMSSDVGNSSPCEDSPCKQMSVHCETEADSQLSDDDAGSYVSVRVDCRSDNVPSLSNCDILDLHAASVSLLELPQKPAVCRCKQDQKRDGDVWEFLPVSSISNCCPSVHISRSLPHTVHSDATVQPTKYVQASIHCRGSPDSVAPRCISLPHSEQLQQSTSGYINLSFGLQSSRLDQSTSLTSSCNSFSYRHPAKISAEINSRPNSGTNLTTPVDILAVHSAFFDKDRLTCDSSSSSEELHTDKHSRKSSNCVLQLIQGSLTKADKEPALPATVAAKCDVGAAQSSTEPIAVSVSSAYHQSPSVHRLPSPDVPPPPVPDDTTTSRLFALCHTALAEHLPLSMSLDSDPLAQSGLSLVKSRAAPKKSASLSSSYSAGDHRHYDGPTMKSSLNEMSSDSAKLSAKIPSHRPRHG